MNRILNDFQDWIEKRAKVKFLGKFSLNQVVDDTQLRQELSNYLMLYTENTLRQMVINFIVNELKRTYWK